MPRPTPAWKLVGFLERFDAWTEHEALTADQREIVLLWLMSRAEDPYQGVRRESGFDNLWWGHIPDSDDDKGHVVVCSYWIKESSRTVRCDNYGLLSWPL